MAKARSGSPAQIRSPGPALARAGGPRTAAARPLVPRVPPARPPLGSCVLATGDLCWRSLFLAQRARVCLLPLRLPLQALTLPPTSSPRTSRPQKPALPGHHSNPNATAPPACLPRPEDAPLRCNLLALDLSKGHFLRRTLLPSPTFPRAQLQKQLLASTLPTFPQRSAHQHLSAPPHSPSPRLGRETPPPSAACPQHTQNPTGGCSPAAPNTLDS